MMIQQQVAAVLAELRHATEDLASSTNPCRFDVHAMERALVRRDSAVRLLGALVEFHPKRFTEADLEEVRISQSSGKRALEWLLEVRRSGWEKAGQLAKNQYVMGVFSSVGCIVTKPPSQITL